MSRDAKKKYISNVVTFVHDSQTYEFNKQTKQTYVYEKTMLSTISTVLSVVLLGVIVYDWFKDRARTLSGYGNVLSGNTSSGMAKLFGFTSGNIKRTITIYGLLLVLLFISYNIPKRQLKAGEVPQAVVEGIQKQL